MKRAKKKTASKKTAKKAASNPHKDKLTIQLDKELQEEGRKRVAELGLTPQSLSQYIAMLIKHDLQERPDWTVVHSAGKPPRWIPLTAKQAEELQRLTRSVDE